MIPPAITDLTHADDSKALESAGRGPAGRRPRAPVPADPALPQLPVLLDPDAMVQALHRSLGSDAPLPDVRIHHVRYARGTKLCVRYDVGLDGRRHDAVAMIAARPYLARRAAKPESVALARLVGDRTPAATPLRYDPDLDALIHWYPLDLELPALAEPPMRLVEELGEADVGLRNVGDPATLAYMPRRRAVLRVGEHVLKIYASHEHFATATANLVGAAGLTGIRTAAFEGCLPGRLVTVQPLLSGSPPAQPADIALRAGELLRELEAAWASYAPPEHLQPLGTARSSEGLLAPSVPPLPGRGEGELPAPWEAGLVVARPSRQLAITAASARYLAAILPALGGRLEALMRELEEAAPSIDRLVLSHGDFSGRQLLVTPDGLGIVDWDVMHLAPAALDPATFAAHLVYGEPGDLDLASEALEKLLEGYGGRPPGLSWYFSACILRHARAPFKYLVEHWPERVEGMVSAAETALNR